jgi:DNA-binding XRE family transcriptional regulator
MDARREEPGQVIRALRLALEMSQAEFARAAGWSASTISSWERGRATPSRLAFKTILAFAEERGVRYRPSSPTNALVRVGGGARNETAHATAATSGPRPALRPLLYPSSAPAGAGHVEPTVASPDPPTWTAEHARPSAPRWHAEASFRISLGARTPRSSAASRHAVEVAIVALGFCAAFGLREPARWLLRGDTVPADTTAALTVAPAIAASAPVAAPRLDAVVPRSGRAQSQPSQATTVAAPAPTVESPTARLESVLAIGAMARATFRSDNDSVTVVPGEWIGGRLVVAIDADGVTLADRAGARHRVGVGQRTPFD